MFGEKISINPIVYLSLSILDCPRSIKPERLKERMKQSYSAFTDC